MRGGGRSSLRKWAAAASLRAAAELQETRRYCSTAAAVPSNHTVNCTPTEVSARVLAAWPCGTQDHVGRAARRTTRERKGPQAAKDLPLSSCSQPGLRPNNMPVLIQVDFLYTGRGFIRQG